MKFLIGSDHRGATAAERIAEHLRSRGHEAEVVASPEGPCDYPEPAHVVGRSVAEGKADTGVLICGTGIGMSIAANKVHGIRAAVVHDELTAQLSRSHNNANVICFSADLIGQRLMEKAVDAFIAAEFEGGRHARRIRKIEAIERGDIPGSVTE